MPHSLLFYFFLGEESQHGYFLIVKRLALSFPIRFAWFPNFSFFFFGGGLGLGEGWGGISDDLWIFDYINSFFFVVKIDNKCLCLWLL